MEDSLDNSKLSLNEVKRRFSESRDMTADARRESQIDDDYLNGYQWTPEERRALAARKQPDLVFNRVRPAVMGMLGVLKQGRPDPQAWARNPDQDQAAEVATKVLKYLCDKNDFEEIRMAFAEDFLVRGTGAVIVEGRDDGSIPLTQVRWEEFFYDPRARRHDFKDAVYKGVAKWVYADYVKQTWGEDAGDVEQAIDAAVGMAPLDPTMQDRPAAQNGSWYDKKLRRVMLVEMYYNDGGKWHRAVFYGDHMLEHGLSPYLDSDKKPCCPIEAQSCFVDRENNRYGVVRDMRGPQDEVNKRRSKLLHVLNNRQVFAESEIALNASADTVRSEAARPDGVLPIGWKPIAMMDIATAQMNLLQEAKSEIERQAPNPAILGRQAGEESGRAHLVRQQAGLTELAVTLGGVEKWDLRVFRQVWARARQFWKAPDYVRVTDDMGAPQFIGINQPQHEQEPAIDPQTGQQAQDPQTGQPATQDRMQHQIVAGPNGMPSIKSTKTVLGYKNALAEMDIDITLDETGHNPNIEHEQFAMLVELRQAGVPIDPMMLIQASSLPGKYKLLQQMQAQAQQPNPGQQLDLADKQAEVQLKGADAQHRVQQANELNARAENLRVNTHNAMMAPHREAFQAGVQVSNEQTQADQVHKIAQQEADVKKLALLKQWQDSQQAQQGNP